MSVCADGTRPTSDHASCEPCALGTAGNRGTCQPCVNDVTDGVTIGKHSPDRIVCEACPDGKEPNVMHTDCTVCPAGHAGMNGVCDLCTSGSAPSSTLTECLMCNDPNEFDQVSHSWASATGVECVACVAGRAADATNSECDVCPPGRYSSDGVTCSFCPPGEEPNIVEFSVGATHCIECLNGTHRHNVDHPELGTMSSCETCSPGQQPNADADDCETCPAGRYSTDGSMCIRCNAGEEPDALQVECQACVGTYSADGEECLACPAGSQPTVGYGASSCTACADLGSNLFSEDGSTCSVCDAGSEVNEVRSACTLCAYGLHSVDGSTWRAAHLARILMIRLAGCLRRRMAVRMVATRAC